MSRLDYPAFDCDNHYYEALDAFTRHVPKAMQSRCVQWAEIDGRKHHLVGGKLAHAVRNPTWNPIAKPGVMSEYFRGNKNQRSPLEMLREREPLPAYYMDHDARIKKLDEQGLEAMWLFPTLGVLYEELLKHDLAAVKTLFTAFNRWLDEDWGVAYKNRIFGAPYISLADLPWACSELEWAISRGARIVVMRPSAVWTSDGPFTASDPRFDPFWARVQEAGITVVVHAGDSGYTTNGYSRDGFSAEFSGGWKPSVKSFNIERAAYDFLITLAYEKLFERFPGVRVASVENGSEYLWTCSASSARRGAHARLQADPSSCSSATSGSTRSGKTT
jgi:predicted TIM-barrel fold metal-dependent hydrolase